ncbi:hypothetical protein WME76_06960 [Sorangium sp. So ce119]
MSSGRGFALLRGLRGRWLDGPDRLDVRAAAIAFLGIGSHLGSARSQNARGHVLGHVKDLGLSSQDPSVRIYQTRERQTFHTDSCDVVALLCGRPRGHRGARRAPPRPARRGVSAGDPARGRPPARRQHPRGRPRSLTVARTDPALPT